MNMVPALRKLIVCRKTDNKTSIYYTCDDSPAQRHLTRLKGRMDRLSEERRESDLGRGKGFEGRKRAKSFQVAK